MRLLCILEWLSLQAIRSLLHRQPRMLIYVPLLPTQARLLLETCKNMIVKSPWQQESLRPVPNFSNRTSRTFCESHGNVDPKICDTVISCIFSFFCAIPKQALTTPRMPQDAYFLSKRVSEKLNSDPLPFYSESIKHFTFLVLLWSLILSLR